MAKEMKKALLFCGFGILGIGIVFLLSMNMTKPLASIVGIGTDEIEKCSILINGTTGPSKTLDGAQLSAFYEAFGRTPAKYIGADDGIIGPEGTVEYIIFFKTVTGTDLQISITSNGLLFYKNRKYEINQAEAITRFLDETMQ